MCYIHNCCECHCNSCSVSEEKISHVCIPDPKFVTAICKICRELMYSFP